MHVSWGKSRRESSGRLPTERGACHGVQPTMTHEMITSAETKSWKLNWLSHPGAPRLCSFNRIFKVFTSPNAHSGRTCKDGKTNLRTA